MRLSNKVALITGASGGIGSAIALAFAREGCQLAVNYFTSDSPIKNLAKQIEQIGKEIVVLKGDVSKAHDVEAIVTAAVERYGRIDILVNNAGMTIGSALTDLTEEVWDKVVDVNMKSVYLCTKAVAKHMSGREGGSVINLSSIGGMIGDTAQPRNLPYNAAKQGLIAMTRTLARGLAPQIRVNAIAPGIILTDFHKKAGVTEDGLKKRIQDVPLLRGGRPEEVAAVAVFLASDESSYITGSVILVDGGLTMP
jgi:3-oxoacyl-[acyl-carrier protein] reductase